ncbi:chaplin [Streptomyces sp. HNM0663]|uniref:Chaplin n=1 Tax=Streptomyces chengmaiensis TaxID=3040919 RepID=A0ABT6HQ65_9ACTN|nr:chaplin [Streptomyces chengmaiensis]MDH2390019.1 chaplin [Streptomyces chengmaiensis]
MRKAHRKARRQLAVAALTGGALAVAGSAYADSHAEGGAAGSPGVLAGNTVQLPVNVPLIVCGNTANVVGLLNPTAGNACVNKDRAARGSGTGAAVEGSRTGSPGVVSGNGVQLPVDLPVNVSGNTVNVVGNGNAAMGNSSSNGTDEPPVRPRPATPPKAAEPRPESPKPSALAESGVGSTAALALPTGAALLLGGLVLYRRSRPAAAAVRVSRQR